MNIATVKLTAKIKCVFSLCHELINKNPAYNKINEVFVPAVGLEPTRALKCPLDFKSNASTNSATPAKVFQ